MIWRAFEKMRNKLHFFLTIFGDFWMRSSLGAHLDFTSYAIVGTLDDRTDLGVDSRMPGGA